MTPTNWDSGPQWLTITATGPHLCKQIWKKMAHLKNKKKIWGDHGAESTMKNGMNWHPIWITEQSPQWKMVWIEAVYVLSASPMTIHSEWPIYHTWLFCYSVRSHSLIQAVHQRWFWHLWLSFQDWDHILNRNGADNFCLRDDSQVPSKFSHCSYDTAPKKKKSLF